MPPCIHLGVVLGVLSWGCLGCLGSYHPHHWLSLLPQPSSDCLGRPVLGLSGVSTFLPLPCFEAVLGISSASANLGLSWVCHLRAVLGNLHELGFKGHLSVTEGSTFTQCFARVGGTVAMLMTPIMVMAALIVIVTVVVIVTIGCHHHHRRPCRHTRHHRRPCRASSSPLPS